MKTLKVLVMLLFITLTACSSYNNRPYYDGVYGTNDNSNYYHNYFSSLRTIVTIPSVPVQAQEQTNQTDLTINVYSDYNHYYGSSHNWYYPYYYPYYYTSYYPVYYGYYTYNNWHHYGLGNVYTTGYGQQWYSNNHHHSLGNVYQGNGHIVNNSNWNNGVRSYTSPRTYTNNTPNYTPSPRNTTPYYNNVH